MMWAAMAVLLIAVIVSAGARDPYRFLPPRRFRREPMRTYGKYGRGFSRRGYGKYGRTF